MAVTKVKHKHGNEIIALVLFAGGLLLLLALVTATPLLAQWRRFQIEPNVPYDGRFTFVRLRYTVHGRSGWEFDYPEMERNLMAAVRERTRSRMASSS